MVSRKDTNKARLKRHIRVRAKISGTTERPRLCVYRSNANIQAQIIDDIKGITLVSASTLEKAFDGNGGNKPCYRVLFALGFKLITRCQNVTEILYKGIADDTGAYNTVAQKTVKQDVV